MNKIPCKIIEDLLPMYIEQVCSNETKEIIENHIKQCDKCAKIFNMHKIETKLKNVESDTKNDILDGIAHKWRKSIGIAFLKGISIAFTVLLLIIGIYYGLFIYQGSIIPAEQVTIDLEEKDGKIFLEMQTKDGYVGCGMDVVPDGKNLYIALYRSILNEKIKNGEKEVITYGVNPIEKDYETIFYGTQDNYIKVWSK